MTINFQYIQMPTSEAMNLLMTNKLNKLGRKFDFIIRADVFFKMENDPSGKGKICEIRLSVPGPRIFAKSDQDDFEKAAASVIKELESQLEKRKNVFKKY